MIHHTRKWEHTILQRTLLLLFVMASGIAFGSTAFDAVTVLKSDRGEAATNAICEIRGERGDPQPATWIFLLNDPLSRSGIREIVISQKKVISDRTPISEYGGVGTLPVLNTKSLKYNSDDAFRIANQQALQFGAGFHWLDYKLTRGNKGAVWKIHLSDYMGKSVGNIFISAETGSIIQSLKPPSASPHGHSSPSQSEWVKQGGLIGHVDATAKNIFNVTKKTVTKTVRSTGDAAVTAKEKVLRVMGNGQEWLTGQRTIGPNKE